MTWLSVGLVASTLLSLFFFPWPLTVVLALCAGWFAPLVPLALGVFADALYATPQSALPLYTLLGAALTALALFVRARLLARIM